MGLAQAPDGGGGGSKRMTRTATGEARVLGWRGDGRGMTRELIGSFWKVGVRLMGVNRATREGGQGFSWDEEGRRDAMAQAKTAAVGCIGRGGTWAN